MNNIPRGTSRAKLMNCLQPAPDPKSDDDGTTVVSAMRLPQVDSGCIITDSRIDDELSVAVIEFSNTPKWLQYLNKDLYGFPKKTALGTLWRWVDIGEIDELGRNEFIRAAIEGNLIYAETLAEFRDTDVNVQDNQGRTALHWASAGNHVDLVRLCLSVPECDIGLRDKDNLTAFDLSLGEKKMLIPAVFYGSMLEMEQSDPQGALLRMLTVTSDPVEDRAIFPGEAIFAPIEDNNKPLVKALIGRGVDLTTKDSSGDTALHLAVKATNVEFAIRLMKAGSDVDAIGKGGDTPLHYAAQTSEKRMVQALLSWEAKPDTKNNQGKRALDLAKDPAMVRHELNRKANDTECLTPLHRAAEDDDPEVLQLLLELGVDVDEKNTKGSGQTALMVAARMGYQDVGELLVEAGANIDATDKNGCTPLNLASTTGFSQLLRGRGATVTGGSDMDIMIAADFPMLRDDTPDSGEELNGEINMSGKISPGRTGAEEYNGSIHRLVVGVQSQYVKGLSPLLQAAQEGDLAKLRILLASEIDLEERSGDDRTALIIAAQGGHTETVQALLASGARVNNAKQSGVTPLHVASYNGHTEAVQALLANGALINNADELGVTALHLAAYNGHTEAVKTLIASGALIDAAEESGATPLYVAAQNGHTETVQELLASGALIDAADKSGATPLHTAAQIGEIKIVQALIAGGADPKAEDSSGNTALKLAIATHHEEIAKVLKAARRRRLINLTTWVRGR